MNWQIVGHEWAVGLLRQSLKADRTAHAYLFTGAPQVGKTRLALAFAQALNCQGTTPPCGHCASCQRIASGTHPDVRVVEGPSDGERVTIEQIRGVRRESVLAPYEGRHRVLVLCRMDRASNEAANSLLKTLEEPPPHVVLILTAVDFEALPPTVVSRCQRVDLRPVASRVVEEALVLEGAPKDRARLLAQLSAGRVGWALAASRDERILHHRQEQIDQLLDLLPADRVTRLGFAHRASSELSAARGLVEQWTVWWRDLFLLRGAGDRHIVNTDQLASMRMQAKQLTLGEIRKALGALQAAAGYLEDNVNTRLALEELVLQLPTIPDSNSKR